MTPKAGFQLNPRVYPKQGDVFKGKNKRRTETRTVRFVSRFHVYYSLGNNPQVRAETSDMFQAWAEKAEVISGVISRGRG